MYLIRYFFLKLAQAFGIFWPVPYAHLFREMLAGYALCEMVFDDDGVPIDFIYRDINPAFERITHLTRAQVIDRRAKTVLPNLESFWIEKYGRVVMTGRAECFEGYAQDVQEHFLLAAFRPYEGHFAVTFYPTGEIHKLQHDLKGAYQQTIEGWSRALDMRDEETAGHSERVTQLTLRLAIAYGYPQAGTLFLRFGALLHDIGKMGIPDEILHKPGPLTDVERLAMQMHPVLGCALLTPIEFLKPALPIPCSHHEHWNGRGYPDGLAGEAIPLEARLFTVVDVWDALTHTRPYRTAWTVSRTREYMQSESGKIFDPKVLEVFLKLDLGNGK